MRLVIVLPVLFLACNGNDDGPPDGPDTGTEPPPPSFVFKSVAPAAEFEANISPDTIEAHKVANMMLASANVVVSDEKVQDLLNASGSGGYRGGLQCWQRDEFPRWSFDIQYATCSGFQMDGAVNINNHPSGKLLFSFSNFRIAERELGGTLALDTNGAFPQPLYWQAYDTDADSPGTDNRVQLGVTVGASPRGLTYDGGANVNFFEQEFAMWGVATISGEPPITVIHGGTDPADVAPDSPPGADVVKSSLNWLDCRCPTSGISAYDMPLEITKVFIDIDDLEETPDGVDDPLLEVAVSEIVEGRAVLEHLPECGTYEVTYTSDAASLVVDPALLLGRITFLCDTLTIDDAERCNALTRAVVALEGDLTVEITAAALNATARAAVDSDFDTTWCRIY
ncbi:MAG TPA: hypothetical protein ENK18_10035 [Deltaproteobacteria bacterium]|nr:hypothetical protein [Deltaproteobacteria bacterium]